jgi:hypothetical protein
LKKAVSFLRVGSLKMDDRGGDVVGTIWNNQIKRIKVKPRRVITK